MAAPPLKEQLAAALDAEDTLVALQQLQRPGGPEALADVLTPSRWPSALQALHVGAVTGPANRKPEVVEAYTASLLAIVAALAAFMLSPASGMSLREAQAAAAGWLLQQAGVFHDAVRGRLITSALVSFFGSEGAAVATLSASALSDLVQSLLARRPRTGRGGGQHQRPGAPAPAPGLPSLPPSIQAFNDGVALLARPEWSRVYDTLDPFSLFEQLWRADAIPAIKRIVAADVASRLPTLVEAIGVRLGDASSPLYRLIRSLGVDPMSFPALAWAAKRKTLNWLLGAGTADLVLYYLQADPDTEHLLRSFLEGPKKAPRLHTLEAALAELTPKPPHELSRSDIVKFTRTLRKVFPPWGPHEATAGVEPPLDWDAPQLRLQTRGLGWIKSAPWSPALTVKELQALPDVAAVETLLREAPPPPTFAYASARAPVLVRDAGASVSYLRLPPYVQRGHVTTLEVFEASVAAIYASYQSPSSALPPSPSPGSDVIVIGVDSESVSPLTSSENSARIFTVSGGGAVWTVDLHALAADVATASDGQARAAAAFSALMTPAAPCPPAVLVHYGGGGDDVSAQDECMPFARILGPRVPISVTSDGDGRHGGASGGGDGGASEGAGAVSREEEDEEEAEGGGGGGGDDKEGDSAPMRPSRSRRARSPPSSSSSSSPSSAVPRHISLPASRFKADLGKVLADARAAARGNPRATPLFVLDLDAVSKAVLRHHPALRESAGSDGAVRVNGGLAGLCELVLGAPLCKFWQQSNWARSPALIPSQAEYACMDAWVLEPILALMFA